jgi:hypothetical protein
VLCSLPIRNYHLSGQLKSEDLWVHFSPSNSIIIPPVESIQRRNLEIRKLGTLPYFKNGNNVMKIGDGVF